MLASGKNLQIIKGILNFKEIFKMEKVIIIGSGCAGMSAAIYAARGGLNPLIIEGPRPGGLIVTTSEVENFPGFPNGIDGFSLVWNMRTQAEKFGVKIVNTIVESVDLSGDVKKIYCSNDTAYEAEKVIIATGAAPRFTGAKNEHAMFGGKGVSTCATCDGAFYKNKNIVVVGGGDSACEEAIFLSNFSPSVTLIHRRDELRASKIMADRVLNHPNIKIVWDSVLTEVLAGDDEKCRGVVVKNLKDESFREIPCSGVFIAIGHIPNTAVFKGQLDMDKDGFIIPAPNSMVNTNLKNVFVAGDCSDKVFRQAITASAMGCMAAISCF